MGNNKSSREIEIILPVTVVDHDAKVAENPWAFQPYPDRPLRDKLETILLIPLIPFVLIYFEIACLGNACK
ncbi:MAG TPA: hypothetical protein VG649_09340 [Candidatus Angelobacter sp.]|nr:hypothetical protein [Candidatus Angelobacter sp.]